MFSLTNLQNDTIIGNTKKRGIMELDALLYLKHIVMNDEINNSDLLVLKSIINNHGRIDFNSSIIDNLKNIILKDSDELLVLDYLEEFSDLDSTLLNLPIYEVFLNNKMLHVLLPFAVEKDVINKASFSKIIEKFLNYLLSFNNKNQDYIVILILLKDIINARKRVNYDSINFRSLIMGFVFNNINAIRSTEESTILSISKEIILKFFLYDYVRLNDMARLSLDGYLDIFVKSLLDISESSILLALITDKSVDENVSVLISEIICNYYGVASDTPLSIQIILSKLRTLQTFKEEKPLALV